MFTSTVRTHLFGSLTPSKYAGGILVAMALLATACSEGAARINAPPLFAKSNMALSTVQSSAPDFIVLANATVTCTDGAITGYVGTAQSSPTGSVIQTGCPINGTILVGDGAAQQAFSNFLSTYTALTPQLGDVCTTVTGTLDGVILKPGSYCYDVSATVTGVLTLDGPSNGIWNIKVGTSGTGALTGTNFTVVMAGGGQACNVTWWVADAVTLTTSAFKGNILAGVPITLTGGTLNGHAWSRSNVTVTGTAVSGCSGN